MCRLIGPKYLILGLQKWAHIQEEALTASETELIHNLVTEKETDSPTNLQKRKAPDDLATSDFSTPRKIRKNLKTMRKILTGQKTKIRTLQQSVRRLRCQASMSESRSELFKRMLKCPRTQKYTPALRSFALTLSFYSTKAYNYVRTTFNNSSPHPKTLSK
ncbi:uncharacterized protein isoform X2 [Leptinotarsa decemlineata]|uniref:uncharacterized protein isoform X2 n=1 Tax=Leptinotarsa decemlineata TaxID=7539 RepID=UPI003D30AE92